MSWGSRLRYTEVVWFWMTCGIIYFRKPPNDLEKLVWAKPVVVHHIVQRSNKCWHSVSSHFSLTNSKFICPYLTIVEVPLFIIVKTNIHLSHHIKSLGPSRRNPCRSPNSEAQCLLVRPICLWLNSFLFFQHFPNIAIMFWLVK